MIDSVLELMYWVSLVVLGLVGTAAYVALVCYAAALGWRAGWERHPKAPPTPVRRGPTREGWS